MGQQVVINEAKSPNIILRFLWFIVIGWWVGYIVAAFAFICEATIIGLPLALYLFDRLPGIMTLKARRRQVEVYEDSKGRLKTKGQRTKQHNLLLRILYFLLIGSWFTAIWIGVAVVLTVTIIGTPVAFWMVDRIPYVGSLAKV
jgi:uncharacterized membrane protein YccF (DUF307 family)